MDFKATEKKIIEIVNRVDPDNLVSYGAPSDEYLTQVHKIISIISGEKDKSLWEDELYKAFFPKIEYQPAGSHNKIKKLSDTLKAAFPEGF